MNSQRIVAVDAWEALDSRGTPTVAAEVTLADGASGLARVPSGASTGGHEAHELRDGGARHDGRGVLKAVASVRGELAERVVGLDANELEAVDAALRDADGTDNLRRLGANAVLAVSVATAVALSSSQRRPLHTLWDQPPLLPLPMVNIFSGGAHAGGLIDVQDLLAVPVGATSFGQAIEWAARVRRGTADAAHEAGLPAALVADEGGLAGRLEGNRAALDLLMRGIRASGLRPGDDVGIAIDVASMQLVDNDGGYRLRSEDRTLTGVELVDEIASWCAAFPIVSVEDLLGEDDWDGWAAATARLDGRQLLGDDLFATDLARLERGIAAGVANAVLVKPNQTGTLSLAAAVVRRAHAAGYSTVVSARSGETEDDWLADLAVGWRAGQIKVGSTMRSERTAKWNRLLHIEHLLGADAEYAGPAALAGP